MCSAGALDVLVYTVAVCNVYVCVQPVLFDVWVYTVAVCNVCVCVCSAGALRRVGVHVCSV